MFCWNTCPVKGILFHRAIFFYIALWKTVTTDPSIFTRPKFHEAKGSWWWQEIQIFIEGMKYFTQKNDSDISFTDSFHKETEYYWYKQNQWLHIRVNADRTCFHDDTSVLLMIYYTADESLFQNLLSLHNLNCSLKWCIIVAHWKKKVDFGLISCHSIKTEVHKYLFLLFFLLHWLKN